ncbi:DUF3572 domain-containing protein [Ruegeria meonggei]|uniref:DUF3572 domain-containing protein n=1 Tax=Ruegeria meonggei TaxID=1446476 RepID=A0A1X6YDG0_9RHOB|nr:DUF3572 domain-containing protein [Ruegeria meonggei]SLN17984.1 hypothetical protein RUM8411_00555 [Ruegeria meonggei]
MPISAQSAETLALNALGWLVGNEELLPVFLGSTGTSEQDLRDRASEPELLGSVLEFLMLDDSWVVAFCDANSVPYELPGQARAVLSGGADVHWT